MLPTITTFGWVPEFARGFVRDMRPRWAFEEVGQPYAVHLISDSKRPKAACPLELLCSPLLLQLA